MFAISLTAEWATWIAALAAPLHRRLAWRLPTVVLAILLLGERLTSIQTAGALTAIAAAILLSIETEQAKG